MQLDGKTALVTGGASGIGMATAWELARDGAQVIVADVNRDGGHAVEAEAKAARLPIIYASLDLAVPGSIDACAQAVLARYQRVDILVNAAGWDRMQPFLDNTPDFIDRVLAINLRGPIGLTQKLLPPMVAQGHGKIVNVASDAGRVGSLGETVYASAKGGIIAFTKSLAREVARHNITVNCVCPGPTDTPLFQVQPDKLKAALEKAIPFRRIAKAQEVADAIAFFAGPRSDYVTAQILSVSGGLTMAG
ncbi:MAG TPA: SDR family oxidoreductase [Acetobacteraceae bacterium]|jgi:2-hydroxycyclohexanecarboxyl-CoA dehydrogenase|nr:SDR family oxidoreductase [Acetobacteraceae bacterium]